MAAHRVDLVNEDDAGRVLLALLEEVAHAACAHAHEHLNEIRTGDGEEGNIGLAGYGARQQRLAGARRPHQQHALGDAATQFLKLLRLAQVLDDLFQFFLGLIHAGHIFERYLLLLHGEQARAALAKGKRLVAARLHLAQHEEPHQDDQHDRAHIVEQGKQEVVLLGLDVAGHFGRDHGLQQVVVVGRQRGVELVVGRGLQMALQVVALDGNVFHLAGLHLVIKIGVRVLRIFGHAVALRHDDPQHQSADDDKHPKHDRFNV